MLKDHIMQYLAEQNKEKIIIFQEEKEYAEKNHLVEDSHMDVQDSRIRFADSYIERCDKASENIIKIESSTFLAQPLTFLKKQKNEFIYLESRWFDLISVEAVSLEADDVFGTYDVMLGLRLQKKFDKILKKYLNSHLLGDEANFDLIFSHEDGLWNLNFALNYVEGFQEDLTIGGAYQLIYRFLFSLVESMEVNMQ